MKKHVARKRSRKGRLTRLALAVLNYASPDIYFDPSQRFQQMPVSQSEAYGCVVAEQLSILSRVENYHPFNPHSRS